MSDSPSAEMPQYQCHKRVHALQIKAIEQAPAAAPRRFASGDWHLVPTDPFYGPIVVSHEDFILRHKPTVGGYYVVYDDGYASFSPAAAFEAGYTRIPS